LDEYYGSIVCTGPVLKLFLSISTQPQAEIGWWAIGTLSQYCFFVSRLGNGPVKECSMFIMTIKLMISKVDLERVLVSKNT